MDLSEEEFTPLMIRDRRGSQRSSSSIASGLQVHLYFFPPRKDATTIHISSGQMSAENVCIQAAKRSGILPVYQSLFGLASGDLSFWYPPSHIFNTEENLQVHFRVRFFFGNWYGQGPRMSYRYNLTRDRISPVLDYSVIDYLFAQVRSDFVSGEAGVAPPLSVQEECLGLAVLDLWRLAKEQHQSVRDLCKIVSYKSCLPETHRHDIQKRNRLDRYRIRHTLKRFLKKLGNCSVDECCLKLKYLVEMAGIVPTLGSEVYHISAGSSNSNGMFTYVKVTGETGIQTSGSCHPDGSLEWQTFCDFQDIIAISLKRVSHEQEDSRLVTVFRHDDRYMGESLGQGSFTRVFKGYKTDIRDGEKHVTDVLLKELDSAHKNCWESFFEAASIMSQISHKHLLLVYGISVHGTKNIMVQEFVKYGALDLYLKRGRSMSVSWKLDVVKQLACALNFLEEKNIVHGNIRAKNLLLAREGDVSQASSPFIKLSDPGVSVAMIGRDVILDRIPWVAPEVLEAPDKLTLASDKWSFGATVWEIFNSGKAPLHDWDLQQKQQFYESFLQLAPSQWTELAELISQCMNYKAAFRPSCRSLIRELNSLITSDYVILHATEPVTLNPMCHASSPALQDQTLFEYRHLRYISLLGKGNFGSVELCRYDPLGDNTGEMVAVKKLQPSKQSSLEDFRKEIKTLSMMSCDYIVKYKGVCYSMGRLNMSLVMEYLPHGSLIVYTENNRHNINTRRLLLFASQICKGMAYLQTLRYVHRDLAARNILVASESLVKIADFGLTKIVPLDKEYYRVKQPGESPIFWYAPESINDFRFSQKSDVWSFGVVLHELFSYCDTDANPKKLCIQRIGTNVHGLSISIHLLNILKDNWRLPPPPNCPPKVYGLMRQCWVYNFEERPCFSSLEDQIEVIMREERENLRG
ncbi:tyrosine-protein kinase JAK2 isoform X2 [Syngnathoides biaculeatus]|uniref:tyrosine-protein kinase JAK2 isoform X2 n=1 Tax=Syngnathoides biaculeatus TaxID=300417 RepID=UPI002ADE1A3D|nr:tyrosine-protein kinase JAK2 isoform X2 [Syngnathoides biaculeatus]